jgi:hypothetical protein
VDATGKSIGPSWGVPPDARSPISIELRHPAFRAASTRRSERPGLREALAAFRAGDTLVVAKLDRLARSLPDAREILADLTLGPRAFALVEARTASDAIRGQVPANSAARMTRRVPDPGGGHRPGG